MDRSAARLGPAAGSLPAAERDLRQRGFLSRAHRRFAEYVERQPEALLRSSYSSLHALDDATLCLAQPWPVFLPDAKIRAFESTAVAVARILLDLPRRVFDNDPARFQEFYRIDRVHAKLIAALINTTDILASATTRGDFLETADGLKCLEFNVSGSLGGWSAGAWTRRYLAEPLIRDFLAETGLEVTYRDPARDFFRHLLVEAGPLAEEGELNVALVVREDRALGDTGRWEEDHKSDYRAALASCPDLSGSVVACNVRSLRLEGNVLRFGDRRIHVVMEACLGELTPPVTTALMEGTVRVYDGPVQRVIADKLNLALLSELADSDLWTAAERETIRAHVPWTRRVSAEFVEFEGERVYLPDLLCDQQERMVIKPGFGAHGDDVFIGPATARGEWMEVVERALGDRGWVAQEFLEGTPYLFQADDDPERPPCAHDLVWGLFTFGEQYGGCFVRLMAQGGPGVINATRGACVGAVLEVAEDPDGSA
jgi:hypothetical protein